jgi:response regulator RpfG family c-di-GMP phosphodiesterase
LIANQKFFSFLNLLAIPKIMFINPKLFMPLSFIKQTEKPLPPPWKIVIVDDEKDIHTITKMALKRFTLDDRGLTFLHAYSAEEGKKILAEEEDVALVFLDVVMETDDAGLMLAKWMREVLNNHFTRIVLRTGQPGQAPEEKVIVEYDINDYKEKTELNRTKLFTTVFTALRAYRDIIKIDKARIYQERYRSGLERVISSTSSILEQRTLQQFFSGLLQQVVSLLHTDQPSALLQITGIGAIYSKHDYRVIAQISDDSGDDSIGSEIYQYLNKAIDSRCSIYEDDILVGYFPSQGDKVSLLFLRGIKNLNSIDRKLLEVFSGNVSLAFDNLLLNKEIIDTQEDLIYRLGDVVESRSNEAGNHIRRMAEVSYLIAKKIGLPQKECLLLKQAAPMHDIGKVATPDAVLLKPGKLDDAEMTIMKDHPSIGYNILHGSKRPILQNAAIISQQHHEKYNGQGYPQGLAGEDIHIFARIVAVADVFDALTHKRCYKEAWPIAEVITVMTESSGSHFDPKVLKALLDNIDLAVAINHKYPD